MSNLPKQTIAFIYTWPNIKSTAEGEFLARLLPLQNENLVFVPMASDGTLLDEELCKTDKIVNIDEVDFVISMHYEDQKLYDSFYYHTLWNPPQLLLQLENYIQFLDNIVANDDFLIYDDGGMTDHLKSMLIDSPRELKNASVFMTSLPSTSALVPNLKNPKLFYCGVNWEKYLGLSSRHGQFFSLLEADGRVNFYGPEKSWEGYSNYKGKIPFDGVSLIKEANECGVVLALSSDFHYRAGAATNRVYEGCAAGAVIISDTNRFIVENFGDSILYIDYDKQNPTKMYEQVKAHLDWICANPDEAMQLAQKAQNIFIEKFALEKLIADICENHENRKLAVAKAKHSQKPNDKVLAVFNADFYDFAKEEQNLLGNTIANINKQIEKNITLIITCDIKIEKPIQDFLSKQNINFEVRLSAFKIFDEFNNKISTRGQILYKLASENIYEYFIILDGTEIVFKDHITTLKRTLEDNSSAIIAYSGVFVDAGNKAKREIILRHISNTTIYIGQYIIDKSLSGAFLFRKECLEYFEPYFLPYLDGFEYMALANLAVFRNNKEIKYSQNVTIGKKNSLEYIYPQAISIQHQMNFIKGLVHVPANEKMQMSFDVNMDSFANNTSIFNLTLRYLYKMHKRKLNRNILLLKFIKIFTFGKKRARLRKKLKKFIEERRIVRSLY